MILLWLNFKVFFIHKDVLRLKDFSVYLPILIHTRFFFMVVNLVVKIRLGNLTIFLLETIRSSGQVQSILRLEFRLDFVNQVEFHFLIIIYYFLL